MTNDIEKQRMERRRTGIRILLVILMVGLVSAAAISLWQVNRGPSSSDEPATLGRGEKAVPTRPATADEVATDVDGGEPVKVKIETSAGTIVAQLRPDMAPNTVANFLAYVDRSFYDGLIFHRVIDGFMIQGGGFDTQYRRMPTDAPILNEARADMPNLVGTLAMARTQDIDSATSQFFINLADNAFLDHKDNSTHGFGYCVFGKVTEGFDVVVAIGKTPTGPGGPFAKDAPLEQVVIKSIRRVE